MFIRGLFFGLRILKDVRENIPEPKEKDTDLAQFERKMDRSRSTTMAPRFVVSTSKYFFSVDDASHCSASVVRLLV